MADHDPLPERLYLGASGRSADDAVPGLDPTPSPPVLFTLEVDGERFDVSQSRDGGTGYTWISGPNPRYGFGTSASASQPASEHEATIRMFLADIDPASGHLSDD